MAYSPIHRPLLRRIFRRLTGGGSADVPGPVNTVAPEITYSGPAEIGTILTCSDGTWITEGTITDYPKQWRRNGVNIDGETGPTYALTADDDDPALISCRGGATDEFDTRYRNSNAVGPFDLVEDEIETGMILDGPGNTILDGSNNPIYS